MNSSDTPQDMGTYIPFTPREKPAQIISSPGMEVTPPKDVRVLRAQVSALAEKTSQLEETIVKKASLEAELSNEKETREKVEQKLQEEEGKRRILEERLKGANPDLLKSLGVVFDPTGEITFVEPTEITPITPEKISLVSSVLRSSLVSTPKLRIISSLSEATASHVEQEKPTPILMQESVTTVSHVEETQTPVEEKKTEVQILQEEPKELTPSTQEEPPVLQVPQNTEPTQEIKPSTEQSVPAIEVSHEEKEIALEKETPTPSTPEYTWATVSPLATTLFEGRLPTKESVVNLLNGDLNALTLVPPQTTPTVSSIETTKPLVDQPKPTEVIHTPSEKLLSFFGSSSEEYAVPFFGVLENNSFNKESSSLVYASVKDLSIETILYSHDQTIGTTILQNKTINVRKNASDYIVSLVSLAEENGVSLFSISPLPQSEEGIPSEIRTLTLVTFFDYVKDTLRQKISHPTLSQTVEHIPTATAVSNDEPIIIQAA